MNLLNPDKKFWINVQIADREYRLSNKDEEIIRKAAKLINQNIKGYSENYDYKDKQDLLAMVVLQYAVKAIKLERQVTFKDNQMFDKLDKINNLLTENNITGKD